MLRIITFHLADISIVILSFKTISRCVKLLVEFKANRLLSTRTLSCRTYTIPTHSFGVRIKKPSVFYAADYCTYTPWPIAYVLFTTIGLSISCGVAYRYLLPAVIGGWSCLSIPISFLNWFRDIFTCLLYTSPSPRDGLLSRMPSSA